MQQELRMIQGYDAAGDLTEQLLAWQKFMKRLIRHVPL